MRTLNERRLRSLLRALDRRERELRRMIAEERNLAAAADDLSLMKDPSSDGADRADARMRSELENRMIDHYLNELASIDAARSRIGDGTFGVCVDCGECIDARRLLAVPDAARCTICQRRHERRLGV